MKLGKEEEMGIKEGDVGIVKEGNMEKMEKKEIKEEIKKD